LSSDVCSSDLAGVERMAVGADVDAQILPGGTGLEGRSTRSARNGRNRVLRMNALLHPRSPLRFCCPNLPVRACPRQYPSNYITLRPIPGNRFVDAMASSHCRTSRGGSSDLTLAPG